MERFDSGHKYVEWDEGDPVIRPAKASECKRITLWKVRIQQSTSVAAAVITGWVTWYARMERLRAASWGSGWWSPEGPSSIHLQFNGVL